MKKLLFAVLLLSTPAHALPTDCSTTITKGGQPQWLIGSGVAQHGFLIQNIDTREAMQFSLTGVVGSGLISAYILPPAQAKGFATSNMFSAPTSFDYTGAVSVVASTTGHKITCTWW